MATKITAAALVVAFSVLGVAFVPTAAASIRPATDLILNDLVAIQSALEAEGLVPTGLAKEMEELRTERDPHIRQAVIERFTNQSMAAFQNKNPVQSEVLANLFSTVMEKVITGEGYNGAKAADVLQDPTPCINTCMAGNQTPQANLADAITCLDPGEIQRSQDPVQEVTFQVVCFVALSTGWLWLWLACVLYCVCEDYWPPGVPGCDTPPVTAESRTWAKAPVSAIR